MFIIDNNNNNVIDKLNITQTQAIPNAPLLSLSLSALSNPNPRPNFDKTTQQQLQHKADIIHTNKSFNNKSQSRITCIQFKIEMYNINSILLNITVQIQNYYHCNVISCCFSQKWKILMLLHDNQDISVYSYHGGDLMRLPLGLNSGVKGLRYSLDFLFFDQYAGFLVLMPTGLKIVYVDIVTNHLRSLFSNAFKFNIKQTLVKDLSEQYWLPFAEKMKRVGDYVYLWNSQEVKIIWHANDRNFNEKQSNEQSTLNILEQGIFKLGTGDIPQSKYSRRTVIHIKQICQPAQQLTYTYYNPQHCLLICGTNTGSLKVLKINTKNIIATTSPSSSSSSLSSCIPISSSSQLLFKLSLHNNKPIVALQLYSPKIILSIGADQYIEVVSFDQMAAIQKFKCFSLLDDICFVQDDMFLAVRTVGFDRFLYGFHVWIDYQLVMQHNSEVLFQQFTNTYAVIALSDNSVNVVEVNQNKLSNYKHKPIENSPKQQIKSQQKSPIKTLSPPHRSHPKQLPPPSPSSPTIPKQSFMPPRCKSILSLSCYPYNINQFWILTDQSQIYRYRFKNVVDEQTSEKWTQFQIIGILELYSFQDKYKHQTKEKICIMMFVDIVPLFFDSDINQKVYLPNFGQVQDVRPIAFGCYTGELLICSSLQPNKIISRFRCFSDPIKSISCCYHPDTQPLIDSTQPIAQSNRKQTYAQPHKTRTIIYSSSSQLICVRLSNYIPPKITYKLSLPKTLPAARLHCLNSHLTAIVYKNSPKILFPCYYNSNIVRLWMPNSNVHQANINCIQYCAKDGVAYGSIVSGDDVGKIAVWDLRGNVKVVVKISEAVKIDIGYLWGRVLCFGYHGKIFQLLIQQDLQQNKEKQQTLQQLLSNKKWQKQFTIQLSLSSMPNHNIIFPSNFRNEEYQQSKQLSNHFGNQQKSNTYEDQYEKNKQQGIDFYGQKSIQIDKYVSNMRKSLVKLEKKTESQAVDTVYHIMEETKEPMNKTKIKYKLNKGKSHSTHKPSHSSQLGLESSKIQRAKSILQRFKQSQSIMQQSQNNHNQTQLTLPQIKTHQNSSTVLKNSPSYQNPPIKSTEITEIEKEQRSIRKKNKNKKYQFLFHFPNTGFYTQLISKNMIQ